MEGQCRRAVFLRCSGRWHIHFGVGSLCTALVRTYWGVTGAGRSAHAHKNDVRGPHVRTNGPFVHIRDLLSSILCTQELRMPAKSAHAHFGVCAY